MEADEELTTETIDAEEADDADAEETDDGLIVEEGAE